MEVWLVNNLAAPGVVLPVGAVSATDGNGTVTDDDAGEASDGTETPDKFRKAVTRKK